MKAPGIFVKSVRGFFLRKWQYNVMLSNDKKLHKRLPVSYPQKGLIMSEKQTNKQKWTSKRIIALLGVVLLVALYIVTLLVAILAPDKSGNMLKCCFLATIAIPTLIWIYIWMYGKLSGKHTIADPDYLKDTDIQE